MTEPAPQRELGGADERPDLAGGDPAAIFGALFDEHARPLYRYLARRVGAATADDLVAETFLVALQSRASYDPQRAALRAWLYGIATNLLRHHLRHEERAYRATARAAGERTTHTDSHEARVTERLDAQARARRLAGALAALTPGDRDVLLLISWAELDAYEVAQALDIPVGTVRSRLHRVRRHLQADAPNVELEDHDG